MKKISKHHYFNYIIFSLLFLVPSFTTASDFYEHDIFYEEVEINAEKIKDPFESFNRPIFEFNNVFYGIFIEPASKFYLNITTEQARSSLNNFFDNLRFPVRFSSNLLQFEFNSAIKEVGKFFLNTTFGIFGVFKPSNNFETFRNLSDSNIEDVFENWGIPKGPYLVLPLLGPSSARSISARFVEPTINPFKSSYSVYGSIDDDWILTFNMTGFFIKSSEMFPKYRFLYNSSMDPYISMRSAFLQDGMKY